MGIRNLDWRLGLGIWSRDWDWGYVIWDWGLEIGDWDWELALGIWNWDLGLELRIGMGTLLGNF